MDKTCAVIIENKVITDGYHKTHLTGKPKLDPEINEIKQKEDKMRWFSHFNFVNVWWGFDKVCRKRAWSELMIAVLHVPVSNLLIRQKQTASIIFTEPLHNLIWLLLYLTEENSYTCTIIILLTTCLLIFQCKTYSTKLAFTSMRWLQILKCLLTAFAWLLSTQTST